MLIMYTMKCWILFSFFSNQSFIRIGSKQRLEGRKVKIQSHMIHPWYQSHHEFDYDIQLLNLHRPLHFSSIVKAIQISGGVCGDNILISGWGYQEEKGNYSDLLQQVRLPVSPMTACQKINNSWYNNTLTASMFCAGGDADDACQGDSGGAAVSYGCLVGISSFGFGCGRHIPGVYINVSDPGIREWIRYKTGI